MALYDPLVCYNLQNSILRNIILFVRYKRVIITVLNVKLTMS